MKMSKGIITIIFLMFFMVGCSYSSLRPEVVDRSDAQRMQTVLFATVLSYGKPLKQFAMISGDNICLLYTNSANI